jgi:hypothetical protein
MACRCCFSGEWYPLLQAVGIRSRCGSSYSSPKRGRKRIPSDDPLELKRRRGRPTLVSGARVDRLAVLGAAALETMIHALLAFEELAGHLEVGLPGR